MYKILFTILIIFSFTIPVNAEFSIDDYRATKQGAPISHGDYLLWIMDKTRQDKWHKDHKVTKEVTDSVARVMIRSGTGIVDPELLEYAKTRQTKPISGYYHEKEKAFFQILYWIGEEKKEGVYEWLENAYKQSKIEDAEKKKAHWSVILNILQEGADPDGQNINNKSDVIDELRTKIVLRSEAEILRTFYAFNNPGREYINDIKKYFPKILPRKLLDEDTPSIVTNEEISEYESNIKKFKKIDDLKKSEAEKQLRLLKRQKRNWHDPIVEVVKIISSFKKKRQVSEIQVSEIIAILKELSKKMRNPDYITFQEAWSQRETDEGISPVLQEKFQILKKNKKKISDNKFIGVAENILGLAFSSPNKFDVLLKLLQIDSQIFKHAHFIQKVTEKFREFSLAEADKKEERSRTDEFEDKLLNLDVGCVLNSNEDIKENDTKDYGGGNALLPAQLKKIPSYEPLKKQ